MEQRKQRRYEVATKNDWLEYLQTLDVTQLEKIVREDARALAVHLINGGEEKEFARIQRLPLTSVQKDVRYLQSVVRAQRTQGTADQSAPVSQMGELQIEPCKDEDPELFFKVDPASIKEAKEICGRCAVRVVCLEKALEEKHQFGVWGGLSENERLRLKRRK